MPDVLRSRIGIPTRSRYRTPFAGSGRVFAACCVAATAVLLAACAPSPPAAVPALPAAFPEADYRRIEAQGGTVLRVDAPASLITVEVRRGGALARLGHDHLVAVRTLYGYLAPEQRRADLLVRLDRMVVDDPELRAAAGFEPALPAAAVDGTRRNMLDKVLDAERFPFALIRVTAVDGERSLWRVAITLHGRTRESTIPARIETPPGAIIVSGRMSLRQSDFGIEPFAVLGGALQVEDRLDLSFRVRAGNG